MAPAIQAAPRWQGNYPSLSQTETPGHRDLQGTSGVWLHLNHPHHLLSSHLPSPGMRGSSGPGRLSRVRPRHCPPSAPSPSWADPSWFCPESGLEGAPTWLVCAPQLCAGTGQAGPHLTPVTGTEWVVLTSPQTGHYHVTSPVRDTVCVGSLGRL